MAPDAVAIERVLVIGAAPSTAMATDTSGTTAEAALDGVYVIRACVSSERMNSDHVVLTYKSLAEVERAFRSLKSIDLHIRPIRHWNDDRN